MNISAITGAEIMTLRAMIFAGFARFARENRHVFESSQRGETHFAENVQIEQRHLRHLQFKWRDS